MRQLMKSPDGRTTTASELDEAGIEVGSPRLRVICVPNLSEDVLRRSGIRAGLRVLDMECGAGDASLLIARLIGPTGLVVGIDRSREAVETAERRATTAGACYWTRFVTADPGVFVPDELFDAVVARLPLFRRADGSALPKLCTWVRPGGAVMVVAPAENADDRRP